MSCRQLISFLGAYLAGELASGVRRRFDAHLAACRECRDYLRSYADTIRFARSQGEEAVPDPPERLVRAVLAARRGR